MRKVKNAWQRPYMALGSLISEEQDFWKIGGRGNYPNFPPLPVCTSLEMWLLFPSRYGVSPTPCLSGAGCDLPWPIEAGVTTCQLQAQASRDHVHHLSWNPATGIRKSLGCLLADSSQSWVTPARPSYPSLLPASDFGPRTDLSLTVQPSPAQISITAQIYHTVWETMTGWCFQTLSLGVVLFHSNGS